MEKTIRSGIMNHSKDQLYDHLGSLFYAIANADGNIRDKEFEKLKTLLRQKWLTYPGNDPTTNRNNALELYNSFINMQDLGMGGNESFERFREYFLKHKMSFTEDLRALIWETAQAIATSYAQKNKSELVILAKLGMLLQSQT